TWTASRRSVSARAWRPRRAGSCRPTPISSHSRFVPSGVCARTRASLKVRRTASMHWASTGTPLGRARCSRGACPTSRAATCRLHGVAVRHPRQRRYALVSAWPRPPYHSPFARHLVARHVVGQPLVGPEALDELQVL